MKNIIKIALLASVALGIASCDLDRFPTDAIDTTQSLKTIADLQSLQAGVYTASRGLLGATPTIAADIQADYVSAVTGYSNNKGYFSTWTLKYDDQDIRSIWLASYYAIADINFVLENIDGLVTTNSKDAAYKENCKGEFHLMRAMIYHKLAMWFCKDYDPASATTDLGLPIIKTVNTAYKPGRATMEDTYAFILEDIAAAEQSLTTAGARNATYLTKDCIIALKANVYLQMHKYPEAFELAESLVKSNRYALEGNAAAFAKMWSEDKSSEIIFKFFAQQSELGGTGYGSMFIYDQDNADLVLKPDYLPLQSTYDMYSDEDIRKAAYFRTDIKVALQSVEYEDLVVMNKYPGNVSLRTNAAKKNYANAVKVYRIAEMYLVATEAAIMNQDLTNANLYLNSLKAKRITGWTTTTYTQANIMTEYKAERKREMMFEGNRLGDLKRWGDGFDRANSFQHAEDLFLPDARGVKVENANTMFVWPIPKDELEANPNMAQNEGYNS